MIYWGNTFSLLIIRFNNSYFWWSIWHFPSFIFRSSSIEQLFLLLHRKEKSARVVWLDLFVMQGCTHTETVQILSLLNQRQCKKVGWECVSSFNRQEISFKIILRELDLRPSVEEWGFLFSLSVEKIEMYWPGKSKLRSSSWVFSKSLDSFLVVHLEKSSTASEVKWSLEMATISM